MSDQPKYLWHYQIIFWLLAGVCLFLGGLTHLDFMVALVRNIYYPIAGFITSFVVIILMRRFRTYELKTRWGLIVLSCIVAALICSAVVNPITFMQRGTAFSDLTLSHFLAGVFNYWLIYLVWGLGYLHFDPMVLAKPTTNNQVKKLMLERNNEIVPVNIQDITHVKAAGDYVEIFTTTDNFLNRATFKSFTDKLDHPDFIQSHRSILVNVNHIKALSPKSKGEYEVILKNNVTVKASRTHSQNVRDSLSKI